MVDRILLGFEIGTGEEVWMEPTHLVCTGVTNKSGKTTLLEGLASRGEGQKFLVFRSKPDEQVFKEGHFVKPFLQEQSDWRYMKQLLESSEKMKLKFETWHIMQAAKNTQNLGGFYENCVEKAKSSKREMDRQIFEVLAEYAKTLLQELKDIVFTREFPELKVGINLMDLSEIKDEDIQSIIIRSSLDYVLHNLRAVITIIPELWKFSPEKRNNPVKESLQALVRQGATKKDFIWADSQDLAGTDKIPLKQCYTWILGLQTEKNEAEHTLDQINLSPKSKPKAHDITSLSLGQFFLSTPKGSVKFYALPRWLDRQTAIKVAKGKMDAESAFAKFAPKDQAEELTNPVLMQEVKAQRARAEDESRARSNAEQEAESLRKQLEEMKKKDAEAHQRELEIVAKEKERNKRSEGGIAQSGSATALQSRPDSQSNYQTAKSKIVGSNPTASTILAKEVNQALPNLEIHQYKPTLKLDLPESLNETSSILGKVAVVLKTTQAPSNNNAKWTVKAIQERITNHSWDASGLEDAIDQLVHWEILTKTSYDTMRFDPKRVQVVDRGATLPVS